MYSLFSLLRRDFVFQENVLIDQRESSSCCTLSDMASLIMIILIGSSSWLNCCGGGRQRLGITTRVEIGLGRAGVWHSLSHTATAAAAAAAVGQIFSPSY